MATTSTATRRTVRPSQRRIAHEGPRYTDSFVGMTALHVTWDGEERWGTVESFDPHGYPVIALPGGRWARGDDSFVTTTPRAA